MTTLSGLRMAVAGALLCAAASPAFAAQGRRGQAAPGQEPGISQAEVQQMFDDVELYQAQQQLKINDDQFPQFLRRFKNLQNVRRMGLNQRMRRVNDLARLLAAPALDEAAVNDQLKALREFDAQLASDTSKAYDAIDQVLNLRQRAQFRVFEERMERQKLELVTRARQANRPRP